MQFYTDHISIVTCEFCYNLIGKMVRENGIQTVREFPGIRHPENSRGNSRVLLSSRREFAGIWKIYKLSTFLFGIMKAHHHENSLFILFRTQITNYFILGHSNYFSFCPFWCCSLFQWYIATIDVICYLIFYLLRVFGKSNDRIWSESKALLTD